MNSTIVPAELAREALIRLASERLAPTPENYAQAYYRIAEQKGSALGISNEKERIPEAVIRENFSVLLLEQAEKLEDFPEKRSLMMMLKTMAFSLKMAGWFDFKKVCEGFLRPTLTAEETNRFDWTSLIAKLLDMYLFPHQTLTPALKRDQFELALMSKDGVTAYRLLFRLLEQWQKEADKINAEEFEGHQESTGEFSRTVTSSLRGLFSDTLRTIAAGYGSNVPAVAQQADKIAYLVATADTLEAFSAIEKEIREFCFKAELQATDQFEVEEGLIRLLETMLNGFDELLAEDVRLKNKLAEARDALEEPMDFARLDSADRALTAIIIALVSQKEKLDDAHQTLKENLFSFIDTFSTIADTTDQYRQKMDRFARKLANTQDTVVMSQLFSHILTETNQATAHFSQTSAQLMATQEKIVQKGAEIERLEQTATESLEKIVEAAQDGGILNRKGIDERLHKEIQRAFRKRLSLCVAVLDIENFRDFIDKFGGKTSDEAFNSLLDTVRHHLKKEDILARYSGEELLLLFPETGLDAAKERMEALQRALTKQFYLSDEKHLVTFNAGVTELSENESDESLVNRAICAMAESKAQGKNKVVSVSAPVASMVGPLPDMITV